MKKILLGLLELGLHDAELEDGTEIRGIHLKTGEYPTACRGWVIANINGREVRFPHRLNCQECGGCE